MTSLEAALLSPPEHPTSPNREISLCSPFGSALRVFPGNHPGTEGHPRQPGLWPAQWIAAAPPIAPVRCCLQTEFSLPVARRIRLCPTADERYECFIDGHSITSGPERGDWENWFFESYDLYLTAGSTRSWPEFGLWEKKLLSPSSP